MKRLGVDPGSARVGLARSDDAGVVAMPLGTIARGGARGAAPLGDAAVARLVAERAAEEGVAEVVVGLPLTLEGREGAAARAARRLAAALEAVLGDVPVVLWDERLTTVAAERALREAGVRGVAQRAAVDQTAATLLLQGYLDAQSRRETPAWTDPDPDLDAPPPGPLAPPGRPRGRGAGRGGPRGGGRGRRR